ncbi:hypothetical protein JOC75_004662 [Metabacillus crassostreae]|uniref:hypothetical protein n=1 Tax=Metabacillus crassostreae TaxID=929098 RepID=UPI001957FA45|nr:hypothetical protein [Metabacillus crassostreae]MBM7606609.1 hypothetical protein [Metabacillus crassostreae]
MNIQMQATLAAYRFAYAVPERFEEIMTNASEMGHNISESINLFLASASFFTNYKFLFKYPTEKDLTFCSTKH